MNNAHTRTRCEKENTMAMAGGREFSDEEVAEFQRLRLAVLNGDPFDTESEVMVAFKTFLGKNDILLGQEAALEKMHDEALGSDFFNRPPWTGG